MTNTLPPPAISEEWEPTPNRKRWTRKECEFLEQNGLLTGRYELIDGGIFFKTNRNPPHRLTIMLIAAWLRLNFGGLHVVTQSPIDVDDTNAEINEPHPDVIVLSQPATAFAAWNIGPADLLLVVEVSDTTLRFDLRNKALLYARAGVEDYWVADVVGRRLIVHRNPTPAGYAEVTEYGENETVAPLARPDAAVLVSQLLPPVQS